MNISGKLKKIEVEFDDSVDCSYFNTSTFNRINNDGLKITDLNLIHSAIIQYQSRFKNQINRSFRYALDTIEPSMVKSDDYFIFNGDEESELQIKSTEVIGVGFSIALFQQLLDVNYNSFNRVLANGNRKRCDFLINKSGRSISLESKGRKDNNNNSNLNSAKKDILEQKKSVNNGIPKYGCITMIPRDGLNKSRIVVTDPKIEETNINRDETIIAMLIYYTKALQLSGYYRLASLLNSRIDEMLLQNGMVSYYENKAIDYGNIAKNGNNIIVMYTNNDDYVQFESFDSPNKDVGFNWNIGTSKIIRFGLVSELKEIIEKQDFKSMLKYSYKNFSNNEISIHNDGTVLFVEDKSKLNK